MSIFGIFVLRKKNKNRYNMTNDLYNVCEVQLSYRPHFKAQERPQISTSKVAHQFLLNTWDLSLINYLEQAKLVLLNRNNRVLGLFDLSKGGASQTVLDITVILTVALKSAASSIIVAHNHPSGNLQPSSADINITKRLDEACKLIGICLHDHLVISEDGYLSLAEENYF